MRSKRLFSTLLIALILFSQGCGSKNQQKEQLQDLGNGICRDTASGLLWQRERSRTIQTFAEAEFYVVNLDLGGYTDWRLPTRNELYDLVYLFDLRLNGECALDCEGKFWSAESSGEGVAGGWEISANQCDPARQYYHGTNGHVRAVRP